MNMRNAPHMLSDMIAVVEYDEAYRMPCVDLLVELQEHLVSVDNENIQVLTENYYKNYMDYVLLLSREHHGQMYIALQNNVIVGLIAGLIEEKDKEDYLTNRCPVRGIITELIVTREARGLGIGKLLMDRMEKYFGTNNCEYTSVSAFAPNHIAVDFYEELGYTVRNIELTKRINRKQPLMI